MSVKLPRTFKYHNQCEYKSLSNVCGIIDKNYPTNCVLGEKECHATISLQYTCRVGSTMMFGLISHNTNQGGSIVPSSTSPNYPSMWRVIFLNVVFGALQWQNGRYVGFKFPKMVLNICKVDGVSFHVQVMYNVILVTWGIGRSYSGGQH